MKEPYWVRFANIGLLSLMAGEGDGGGGDGSDGSDDSGDDDGEDDGDAEKLGDAGKKALDKIRGDLRAERKARRDAESKLAAKETNDANETARREAQDAATAKANIKILKSEVKAAAATLGFHDPADAHKFLDLDDFDVDDDGDVDADALKSGLQALMAEKPYLAKSQEDDEDAPTTGRPKPDLSQGARGKGTKASTGQSFAAAVSKHF